MLHQLSVAPLGVIIRMILNLSIASVAAMLFLS